MSKRKQEACGAPAGSIRGAFQFAKDVLGLKQLVPLQLGSAVRRPVPNPDDPAAYPDDLNGGLACDLSEREAVVDAECALAGRAFEVACGAAGFPIGPCFTSPDGAGGGSGNRHYLYRTSGDTASAVGYRVHAPAGRAGVVGKALVLEVLGQGRQVTLPPSRHRNGDDPGRWGRYEWRDSRPAPRVTFGGTADRVGLLNVAGWAAAGAQLTLLWPPGPEEGQNRHAISLAAAGVLARAGVPRAVAEAVIHLAATEAGDPKADDRQKDVHSTYDKLEGGRTALLAAKALRKALGDAGMEEADADAGVAALLAVLGWEGGPGPSGADGDGDESAAARLVRIAEEECELWADPDGMAYVTVRGTTKHSPVASTDFEDWLTLKFHEQTGMVVGAEAINNARRLIGALGKTGDRHPVFVRTAWTPGATYLDLGGAGGRSVRVTPDGWAVMDEPPPVRFHRPSTQRPLPEPRPGGSLDLLRGLINCSDAGFDLIVAWLLAALYGRQPFPVLVLRGPQGSAKSSATRILKELIDPTVPPHRGLPRSIEDLFIAASRGLVLAFDNVSDLPATLSDAICRLSTGGGEGKRQLYKDTDEVVLNVTRPVILNGIGDLIDRPDLLERALLIDLEPIPDHGRRTERQLQAAVCEAGPLVLGALLDRLAVGLRNLPHVVLSRHPRMADFAELAVAAEGGEGRFLAAYDRNRGDGDASAMDGCPYSEALVGVVRAAKGTWTGTATDLLERLRTAATPAVVHSFPKSGQALSTSLKRMVPAFGRAGLTVTFGRDGTRMNGRVITIVLPPGEVPAAGRRTDASDASDGTGATSVGDTENPFVPLSQPGGTIAPAVVPPQVDQLPAQSEPADNQVPPAVAKKRKSRAGRKGASGASENNDPGPAATDDLGRDLGLDGGEDVPPVVPLSDTAEGPDPTLWRAFLAWAMRPGFTGTPEAFAEEHLISVAEAEALYDRARDADIPGLRFTARYFAVEPGEGES